MRRLTCFLQILSEHSHAFIDIRRGAGWSTAVRDLLLWRLQSLAGRLVGFRPGNFPGDLHGHLGKMRPRFRHRKLSFDVTVDVLQSTVAERNSYGLTP